MSVSKDKSKALPKAAAEVAEAPAVVPSEDMADIDRLDPVPDEVTLESGTVVRIQPLKARQFFKLLRIVTRGGASVLPTMNLSMRQGEEEFLANLMALVLFAIPEAEYETVEFILSMVEPKSTAEGAREALEAELENPELGDLVDIVEAVVRREAPDIRSLGKRLQKMFQLAQRVGEAPKV